MPKAMPGDEDDTQPISGAVPKRAVAYRSKDVWIAQILEYDLTAEAGRLEDLPAEVERVLTLPMGEPSEGVKTAALRFWEMYQGARARVRPAAAPYSTEIRLYEGASSPALNLSELGPFRRQDYLRLADEPRCELLYGWFLRCPSERPAHQVVVSGLSRRLDDVAVKGGGLVFTAPLDTALADHTIVQPDIVYVAGERIAEIVAERIEGAPELVVEVLSPNTIRRDRGAKLRAYAEGGVGEYWLVDPWAFQIDFLVNRGDRFEVALALDGIFRSEACRGLEMDLADFWQDIEGRLALIGEGVEKEQDGPGTPEA